MNIEEAFDGHFLDQIDSVSSLFRALSPTTFRERKRFFPFETLS